MSKPTAIVYFKPGAEALAKSMSASVRAQNKEARLCASSFFTSCEGNASVVLVQDGARKAQDIFARYQAKMPHVELYSYDEEGNIRPHGVPNSTAETVNADPAEETPRAPADEVPAARTSAGEVADDSLVEAAPQDDDRAAVEAFITR